MPEPPAPAVVGAVLFDRFEVLDVFGPVELFAGLRDKFSVITVGLAAGPVVSAQGVRAVADHAYAAAPPCDIVLVPGGIGTRTLVEDRSFLEWLAAWSAGAAYVTSVCTGSGVLAAAGLLDGHRATSNKRAFGWASAQGTSVSWVPEAHWVADRDRWTSSGVAAGMDMALGLIAHLHGEEVAGGLADAVEYEWHRDPGWDPFAALHGLVPG